MDGYNPCDRSTLCSTLKIGGDLHRDDDAAMSIAEADEPAPNL